MQYPNKKIIGVDETINIAFAKQRKYKSEKILKFGSKSEKNIRRILDFNAQLGQYNSIKFDQSFQAQTIPFPTLFGAKNN